MLGHDINTIHGVVSLYSIASSQVEWIEYNSKFIRSIFHYQRNHLNAF